MDLCYWWWCWWWWLGFFTDRWWRFILYCTRWLSNAVKLARFVGLTSPRVVKDCKLQYVVVCNAIAGSYMLYFLASGQFLLNTVVALTFSYFRYFFFLCVIISFSCFSVLLSYALVYIYCFHFDVVIYIVFSGIKLSAIVRIKCSCSCTFTLSSGWNHTLFTDSKFSILHLR